MAEQPYSNEPMPGWGEAVARWPWQEWNDAGGEQEGMKKGGLCPKCGHDMIVYQRFILHLDRADDWVAAYCNCERAHEGRPSDAPAPGCGQGAEIRAWTR